MFIRFNKQNLKQFDYLIIIIIIALAIISYLGISSIDPSYAVKQMKWYLVAFLFMLTILFIDREFLLSNVYPLYGFGTLLLIGVLLFGNETKGIVGWYDFGGIKFQPSELMKIILILTIAKYLSKREEEPFSSFFSLFPLFLLLLLPLTLILMQPDLGTALIFVGILLSMMLTYGVKVRHFLLIFLIVLLGVGFLVILYFYFPEVFFKILKPYQWKRLTSFIDPFKDAKESGYQIIQSLIAVGSGELSGKGYLEGTQGKLNFIPEAHTDFIFAVIAEQFGFIGASILILLFFILIYRIIKIGIETNDLFGKYVISGIVGMFVFQIFENIGMTISLMPITGIPLPFISYGGSSLLTNMITIGIILNIGMNRKRTLFD